MKKLDQISADLFNKIRGRFENVTIGDENGKVTNVPEDARYFDFAYLADGVDLGKVSVALDAEQGLSVIVGRDLVQGQMEDVQDGWYNFLKELRVFAKKRMMKFEVRDINKSNLNKRDYEFLAQNRNGENTMAESKMYGNDRTSFQKVGKAKIAIKHSAPINVESASSRTGKIAKIFIETPEGEKFRFPYKHLAGARAMARHVAEGGHAYDDFGKYITSLSEEMHKIRKLNTYMGRSAVMAETLDQYSDILKGRVSEVRKEIANLQKPAYYAEAVANFVAAEAVEVPDEVAENWIDQLTIKQFNEELKDVFPYVYKLIGEATKAEELGPDDLMDESALMAYAGKKKHGAEYMKKAAKAGREGASQEELGRLKDKYSKAEKESIDDMLEAAIDQLMGQFAESEGESEFDGHDIMSEDPPNGIDFDYANLSKVNWAQYSEEDIKTFYSIIDNLDFESGYYNNNDGEFDGSHAKALQWLEKNVMKKDKDTNPAGQEEGNDEPMSVKMTPDGGIEKADEKPKTPIGEFILSYFDRENGTFPKGETAVLTMVEKDYGEQYVEPAARFIQKVESIVAQRQAEEMASSRYPETDRIKALAGLN